MKKYNLLILLLFLSLMISCAKKNDVNPGPVTGTVTINGSVYPTVTIGNQVWTTQNYSGPGGNEVAANTGDPILNGNYYNADNIVLPAGWRIPSRQDFNTLLSNYSSAINASGDVICDKAIIEGLISTTGWDGLTGTNSTGFNAYSAGSLYGNYPNLTSNGKTIYADYLTTNTDPSTGETYELQIDNTAGSGPGSSYTNIATIPTQGSAYIFYVSIRFVKNK